MSSLFEKKLKNVSMPIIITSFFDGTLHPDKMSAEQIEQYHLESLKQIVQKAYEKNDFYREKLDEVDVKPTDIQQVSDLSKLPFLTKDELRGKPYILLTCDKQEIALVQVSTGTTGGEEIYMMYTWNDYYLHDLAPRYPELFPVDPGDVCLNALPYEMSAAGLAFHKTFMEGCEATVIPAGKGGAYSTPKKTLKMIQDLTPNIVITTPSWAMLLAEEASEQNFDLKTLQLKKLWITGEGCSPAFRQRLEELWGVTANFFYGSLECGVLGIECDEHDGYHIAQAHAIVEIVDPKTGESLDEGEIGEIVVTSALRYDTPILRFRTGDLGYIESESCSCGVTMPKFYLRGRVVDQIRYNGTSLSPFYLEEFLMREPEIGNWFEFVLKKEGDNDVINVRCELASTIEPSEHLADSLASRMEFASGIPFAFEFVEKLPRPQGKTVRVVYE
ncbi:phenylacetate--CoA ligase family protein [Metabacillus bambusae]|uniref:AMP-binding protein n=1 Tax=Metabacillus bambusae TaxID=2795218 RepID=A0ABS3N1V4_9BACI|nr:AMP-binding protein [Metabacillus bambusae]MBO1512158.1 AMP-binding protein [Metabacillus bambusae]